MEDFCLFTMPGLCGKLSFDVPVIEILLLLLTSAIVTGVTVFASMRLAERQTRLTLEHATTAELRGVIADLAAGSQARFNGTASESELQIRAVAADSIIRTSKLPHADIVATWVDVLGMYAQALKINPRTIKGFDQPTGEDLVLRQFGPGQKVSKRLAQWLVDHEAVGVQLAEESTQMKSYVNKWHLAEFVENPPKTVTIDLQ